jgi:hypothetical protein
MQLRCTPSDDRCFAATAFWRRKWELGQASSFGIGDRPSYRKEASVAPNNYGDVAKLIPNTRNNVNRSGITIHPKFPSMEERYRDLSWPKSGPGPGKYDTRIPAGQGSWHNPTANPSYSMGSRPILQGDMREAIGKPGPPDYEVITQPGTNSKIKKGPLYNITVKAKHEIKDGDGGGISPGPARYNHKAGFDTKGHWEKVKARKGPPAKYWRKFLPEERRREIEASEVAEQYEEYEGHEPAERGRTLNSGGSKSSGGGKGGRNGRLPRIESSPATL